MYRGTWITVLLVSLKCMVTFCFSVERYEIVIYQQVETQNSSLSCLSCYNGDTTNDCITLKNISNIPTKACKQGEKFCKVRRLNRDDILVTFDRYCASVCEPGCRDGARYHECISCCNHKSQCNVDNSAPCCEWQNGCFSLSLLAVLTNLLGKILNTKDKYYS